MTLDGWAETAFGWGDGAHLGLVQWPQPAQVLLVTQRFQPDHQPAAGLRHCAATPGLRHADERCRAWPHPRNRRGTDTRCG